MFTRIVEMNAKGGNAREVTRTMNDKALAILKKQPGFVDEIMLVSEQNPGRLVAISFWDTKEDAEKYNRETYPKLNEIISGQLEGPPKLQTFNVENSTAYNITAGKAA
jgi:heme-degrading monooxygenase HmoA